MSEIIEITFETVQIEKVANLLINLVSSSTLSNYQISTDTPHIQIDLQGQNLFQDSITHSSDGTFYFNFLSFNLNGLHLSQAGLQIYKYINIYDLNMHVEREEIAQKISVSKLHSWSKFLAHELKAKTFFCGYEPAIDEDTRFFSENTTGPLKAW